METTQIGIFDLAEKRLAWSARRQAVLASNIANANTPGYRAKDIASFAATLAGMGNISPTRTQSAHLSGSMNSSSSGSQSATDSRAIDGNSVKLDQQLMKVADAENSQSLVTTIWKKYVGMFNIALGRQA